MTNVILFGVLLPLTVLCEPALAYVDPVSSKTILHVLSAAFIVVSAGFVFLKHRFAALFRAFGRMFRRRAP